MKDGVIPFTLFGLVLTILSLVKVYFESSESMILASDRYRGEGVWTFTSLSTELEGVHSFSFISTPSREQMTSDGHNIVQAGFHSCFYASLDHSLTGDVTLCLLEL